LQLATSLIESVENKIDKDKVKYNY